MNNHHEIEYFLIKKLSHQLKIKSTDIDCNRSLTEYGLGSLQLYELLGQLEKKSKTIIDPSLLSSCSTINQIADHLSHDVGHAHRAKSTKRKMKMEPISNEKNYHHHKEIAAFKKLKDRVDAISGSDIYLCPTEGIASNTTVIHNHRYINFASYNYLGMSGDPAVTQAVIDAVLKYGSSVSGSRLIGGQKPIHEALEKEISELIGTEDAIVFNSGHACNVTTIGCIVKQNDLILLDQLSHNSIVQGAQLSHATIKFYKHNDAESLEMKLTEYRHQFDRVLIVTEGVFSMDGDIPPIEDYIRLKKYYQAMLYIDEAHSMGVIGKLGHGVREYFNIQADDVDFWMGTLSKAFAACGGYIAGKKDLIEYLKFSAPGFVYSCGLSPADTAAALSAVRHLKTEGGRVKKLQERAHHFYTALKAKNIPLGRCVDFVPVIPILVGDSEKAIKLHVALKTKGIYMPAIFYPAVEEGASRLRAFINASHTLEQLNDTADILEQEMKQLKLLK